MIFAMVDLTQRIFTCAACGLQAKLVVEMSKRVDFGTGEMKDTVFSTHACDSVTCLDVQLAALRDEVLESFKSFVFLHDPTLDILEMRRKSVTSTLTTPIAR